MISRIFRSIASRTKTYFEYLNEIEENQIEKQQGDWLAYFQRKQDNRHGTDGSVELYVTIEWQSWSRHVDDIEKSDEPICNNIQLRKGQLSSRKELPSWMSQHDDNRSKASEGSFDSSDGGGLNLVLKAAFESVRPERKPVQSYQRWFGKIAKVFEQFSVEQTSFGFTSNLERNVSTVKPITHPSDSLTSCINWMHWTGYLPLAVSPDNMIQSALSNTALATSLTSARVGRGFFVILSNIYKADGIESSLIDRLASHLCGTDRWFSNLITLGNHHFLGDEDLLWRNLDTHITPSHHDSISFFENGVKAENREREEGTVN